MDGGGRLVLRQADGDGGEAAATEKTDRRDAYPTNVRPLAMEIASLLGEINRLRRAVWHREAELAAGVPVAAGES